MNNGWTHIPNERIISRTDTELAVREWEPGDGVFCGWATRRSKYECTEPVAVLRTIDTGGYRGSHRVRTRVLCARHLGETFRSYVGDNAGERNPQPLTVRAEKAAREAILAAHWDEYQKTRQKYIEAAEAELVELVPEDLRRFLVAGEDAA